MGPTNSCWTMGFIILKPPLTHLIVQCTTFARTSALARPLVNYGSRESGEEQDVTLLLTLNAQMFSFVLIYCLLNMIVL